MARASPIKNAVYLFLAKGVTVGLRLIYVVAISRVLGAEQYGIFSYGLAWYGIFVPVAVFGTDFVMVRDIAADGLECRLIQRSLGFRLVAGMAATIAAVVLGVGLVPEPSNIILVTILSCAVLARGLASWVNAVNNGLERSRDVLLLETTFRFVEVVVGLTLLVFFRFGVIVLAAIHVASWYLQSIAGMLLLRKHYYSCVFPLLDMIAVGSLVKRGMPFMIGAFMMTWILQGIIVMSGGIGIAADVLGQIALASQLLGVIALLVTESAIASIPVLARSVQRRDGKDRRFVRVILLVGAGVSVVATVGASSLGSNLISAIWGDEFLYAADLLPWAMLATGPFVWFAGLRSLVSAHGQQKLFAWSTVTSAILFTGLFFVLVPLLGPLGGYLGLALALTASVAIQLVAIAPRMHKGPRVQ